MSGGPIPAEPDLLVVTHPLAAERLTVLRDETTGRAAFRAALHDLTGMLVYEATRDLPRELRQIRTPLTATTGVALPAALLLVPVLRAGLGMLPAASALLPEAPIGFVGLERDETTWQPRIYLESLPASLAGRQVLLLDPMLATGGSLRHAARLLRDRDAERVTVVCVLAAPEGLAAVTAEGGERLRVVTAAVDDGLDENAYIVPGLGDAGDRQFDI